MSPFLKGALGFLGCAAICTAAYQIGKAVGREETLDEIEREELRSQPRSTSAVPDIQPCRMTEASAIEVPEEDTQIRDAVLVDTVPAVMERPERTRKMRGWKNTIFGGASVIKDLFRNPDGKQLTMTVENGDVVARISQKGCG